MTTTLDPNPLDSEGPESQDSGSPGPESTTDESSEVLEAEDAKKRAPLSGVRFVAVSALLMLAATTLGFVATLVGVSQVQHARDQEVIYSDYRYDLANAIATVGQTDIEGQILPMGAPVAVLLIPEIGVQEVVLNGTTSAVMQSGPALRRDTVLPGQPGNSVIFGRQASYGGPFGDLERLHQKYPGRVGGDQVPQFVGNPRPRVDLHGVVALDRLDVGVGVHGPQFRGNWLKSCCRWSADQHRRWRFLWEPGL